MSERIIWAIAILAVDLLVFFFPLSALFLGYVLILNPAWFRDILNANAPAQMDH
jgi:hypothetical protein